MKFKIFKFKQVKSTNDTAINLIKKKIKNLVVFLQIYKRKEEELTEKNGYQ